MARVAVMGSGSWGTAFSLVLADAGHDVCVWSRDAATAEEITTRHSNERYHPGVTIPSSIRATTDPAAALADATVVVLAVPSKSLRDNLSTWTQLIPAGAVVVSLIKGIEASTSLRMSEVIARVTGIGAERIAVISGPNLAAEIIRRDPAGSTIACVDERVAVELVQATATPYFRSYFTSDVVGTEIGGSVKNVIALANGIAVGLGFGENAQSALITRGLAEMSRLGVALGASPMTFLGLAGIGDLVATCSSPLSRNRSFGVALGRGGSVAEVEAASKQTCEAVVSCRSIHNLALAHNVEMPITEQVVRVVHEGLAPEDLLAVFMARKPRAEQGHG